MSKCYGKIYPVSFGFALGLFSGLGWMLFAWAGARWGFGLNLLSQMSTVFDGLAPTFVGGLWGFFWGFIELFVFGVLSAAVYNGTLKCFAPGDSSCDSSCK